MTGRRAFCRSLMRGLAVLALGPALDPPVAGAAAPDPRLADNPALNGIAATHPAEAERLLRDIDLVLQQPAQQQTRGGPDLDVLDEGLIDGNPLLGQVYIHNAAAALELLKRIKQARNGGR